MSKGTISVSLLFLLILAQPVLNQPVQPPAKPLDCNFLPSLMALAFDTRTQFGSETRKWLVLRKVFETEFKNEQEASAAGIDLSFVYQYIPIDIKAETDFQRLLQYKKTSLSTDLNFGSVDVVKKVHDTALNVAGLGVIRQMYKDCVKAVTSRNSAQLTCAASEVGDVITIVFNFDPPASLGRLEPPKLVKGSTVTNAAYGSMSMKAGTTTTTLTPFTIPPGGKVLTLHRISPDHPVTFALNTSPQGKCQIDPLPAGAVYTVVADITATGVETKEVYEDFGFRADIPSPFCSKEDFLNNERDGCLRTPGVTAKRAELIEADQPPYLSHLNQTFQDCFKAARVAKIDIVNGSCFKAFVRVRQCGLLKPFPEDIVPKACVHAYKNGTPYAIRVFGVVDSPVTLPTFRQTLPAIRDKIIRIKYGQDVSKAMREVNFAFSVTIVNTRSPQNGPIELTRQSPSAGGASANFDAGSRELIVSLP